MKRLIAALVMCAAFAVPALSVSAPAAHASTEPVGARALDWAEAHATGDWYGWGGTGPYVYDCSGLVYRAAAAEGIALPRTTYGMAYTWHLVRTYYPQRGDIAFWGPSWAPYHVGFVTIWHNYAFGALQPGTRIGWYSFAYWQPSGYWQLR